MALRFTSGGARRITRGRLVRGRRGLWLAAALAGLVSLGAIAWAMDEGPAANTTTTCMLVFDSDRGTAAMHERYIEWAKPLLRQCASRRARVYALPATSATATDTVSPVDLDLAQIASRGENPDRAVAAASSEIADMVTMAAKSSGFTGTDLLAAGSAAEDVLGDRSQVRTLAWFSDGLHARHPYNLTVIPLDDAGIDRLINRLRADGLIPTLNGVVVRWYGAGIGTDADKLAPERLAAIERFWRRYFAAAGATVEIYARTP